MTRRWVAWFTILSLPLTVIFALWMWHDEHGPEKWLFMAGTTLVAALCGWAAEGRRWLARTLLAVPIAGAAYGTITALACAPPYFFVGTIIGLVASVPYLPILLLAAAIAEGQLGATRVSARWPG